MGLGGWGSLCELGCRGSREWGVESGEWRGRKESSALVNLCGMRALEISANGRRNIGKKLPDSALYQA
jgi:hypothetical protein